ncbi:hypothetical protein GMES_1212 [Paraglaciecola mesophila KMM 241]|uniref:Uncharacterized protein n=1 Tax=Paraglaciecola mesophila KMM 241 TaxID=1128912 RepID=K6YHQ1_9ALTE|nr:hypothetical protein GMES_1212 [Paraglaciecola mesophila KMM 241]
MGEEQTVVRGLNQFQKHEGLFLLEYSITDLLFLIQTDS